MRYAAPIHFSAVNIVAELASSTPNPSTDAVIALKSPSATPATVIMPERRPWPSAYDTTRRTVGPGIARRIVEVVTNASHAGMDMKISLVQARLTDPQSKPERNSPPRETMSALGHVWTAPWQEFLTLLQHWSGAVTCPACLCGGFGRWP